MSQVLQYWPYLLRGLLTTLLVTALGALVALVTAFVAGLARLSEHWFLRWPAAVFVEVFRGTSMLVQMFWLFYVLPFFGLLLHPMTAGVLALGLNEGAYGSEIVRGAIKSRTAGQNEACIALSMGRALRLRRVLIPQAIPSMIPPFGNVLVDLLKNSSLVSLVTVSDLTWRAQTFRTTTGQTTAIFLTLLVIYFVLSVIVSLLVRWLEHHFAIDRERRSTLLRRTALAKAGV